MPIPLAGIGSGGFSKEQADGNVPCISNGVNRPKRKGEVVRRLPLLVILSALLLMSGGLSGCGNDEKASAESKGTFEEIGESMDDTKQAAEETANSAEETADKIEDAADDAGDGNE